MHGGVVVVILLGIGMMALESARFRRFLVIAILVIGFGAMAVYDIDKWYNQQHSHVLNLPGHWPNDEQ